MRKLRWIVFLRSTRPCRDFRLPVRLRAGLGGRIGRLFTHLHAGKHPLQLAFGLPGLVIVRGVSFPFPRHGLALLVLETPEVLIALFPPVVEVGLAVGRPFGFPAGIVEFFRVFSHLDQEEPLEGLVEGRDVLAGLDQGGPQGRLEGRPFGDLPVPKDFGGVQGLGHGYADAGLPEQPGELNQPLDHGSLPA